MFINRAVNVLEHERPRTLAAVLLVEDIHVTKPFYCPETVILVVLSVMVSSA